MPEPTISVYINVADSDDTPNLIELSTLKALYWLGPETTENIPDPITREVSNKWAEELWVADAGSYGNGTQVLSYHLPGDPTQRAKMLVIKLESGTLSDKLELTAYDNTLHNSTDSEIFGTDASGNTPWIKAKPTGVGSSYSIPPSNWCTFDTASTEIVDDAANALKGTIYFVRWSSIPVEGEEAYAVLAQMVPYDASAGWKDIVICVRYKWVD